MSTNYVKYEEISLKTHPELNEKWVQEIIANDPSVLGLGDLILKDKERIQPSAGRLDLLMQDAESSLRYEVEIQLGKTDESHIIRTIEYWDIEKKRYPKYEHCAVIVAEDITSRFLNVISLFNGSIPLIAIQMKAIKVGGQLSLVFTKVLDQLSYGSAQEEEEEQEKTDKNYWLKRGAPETVKIAEQVLEVIKSFNDGYDLNYNKFYIGLTKSGISNNFAIFRPKKRFLRVEIKLEKNAVFETECDNIGVDLMDYDTRGGRYRFRLEKGDVEKHAEFLNKTLKESYEKFNS